MAVATSFRVERIALVAGILTPIRPLLNASDVNVSNPTGSDLEIHTNSDGTEYGVVSSGFQWTLSGRPWLYTIGTTAFWLKSVGGGTVVVVWVP